VAIALPLLDAMIPMARAGAKKKGDAALLTYICQ
jgi:hypothetical protein